MHCFKLPFAFLAVTLMISCSTINQLSPALDSSNMRTFQAGRLEFYRGIPFITLAGSHYAMGLQYGVLLREELTDAIKRLKDIEKALEISSPWYFRPFMADMFKTKVKNRFYHSLPTKYRDELKGIAQGSGLAFDDILFAAAGAGTFEFACTSIISEKNGRILLGRNLDWAPGFFGEMPVFIRFQPDYERAYVSAGFLICPMAIFTGMSDSGIAVSLNFISYYKTRRATGMPMYYILREILASAQTLSAAESILNTYEAPESWIVSVVSAADSRGAQYEVTAQEIFINNNQQDASIYALNGFSSSMNKKYTPLLASSNVLNDSRPFILETVLRENQIGTVDQMLAVLGHDGFSVIEETHWSGKGVNHEGTLQTAVMDPQTNSIYFGFSPVFAGWAPIVKYDFQTKEIVLYRPGNQLMETEEIQSLGKWYPDYFTDLYSDRGDEIIGSIQNDGLNNPLTWYCLYDIWNTGHAVQKNDYIKRVFEDISISSSKQGFIYILAGMYFLKNGDYKKAEESLLVALKKHCFPDEKIQILSQLARLYAQLAEYEKMKEYAQICVDVMQSYEKDFLFTHHETDILQEMRMYLRMDNNK